MHRVWGLQGCGQTALTSQWHKQQAQILLPLLLRGLGNRTLCGSQFPACSGQKSLENSKVSESGPPACMEPGKLRQEDLPAGDGYLQFWKAPS